MAGRFTRGGPPMGRNRFVRRPPIEKFKPGRVDARIGEARAMLSVCTALERLTAHGLACQFNLRDETAASLIAEETQKRGGE